MWQSSRAAKHLIATTGYGRRVRIAIVLFDGAEELDFAGPWEVLAYWARAVATDAEVFTVADSLDPIVAAKGMRVLPDRRWAEAGQIDVLVVPGGRGTRRLLAADDPLHERLRAMASEGTLMTSVCTGALVYAAAGMLRGRPATTHWDNLDELAALDETIEIRRDARYVDDGDVITAAGVSAGIDMALHLVARLDSVESAQRVKREIQYTPQPPI